ncbi:MAG: hypothetical protein Q9208_007177 [Pyrenodesmia sp. 3 TL-2023]
MASFLAREAAHIDEADCLWVLSPMNGFHRLPLPFPVDHKKHEGILQELDLPDMFGDLVHARSAVCSALATTVEDIVELIAKGARIYSRTPSEDTINILRTNTEITLKQIKLTLGTLDRLDALYDKTKDGYRRLATSAMKAYEEGQLKTSEIFQLMARSSVKTKFGAFDANKAILEPLQEKTTKKIEAHRGLVAWRRDTQRIDLIREVVQEMERSIRRFATSLSRHKTGGVDPGNNVGDWGAKSISGHAWLREWHRQEVAGKGRLRSGWIKLLASVGNDEETLEITIRSEWCLRVDTMNGDGQRPVSLAPPGSPAGQMPQLGLMYTPFQAYTFFRHHLRDWVLPPIEVPAAAHEKRM